MSRSFWQADLTARVAVAGPDGALTLTRRPTTADAEVLAELMLDAYVDTIDYEGETIIEALSEVGSWFEDPSARPEWSIVALDGEHAVGAVLAGEFGEAAFVHYVMVRSTWKGRGLAGALLASALADMRGSGRTTCRAAITDGNAPSERLFTSAGFRVSGPV